MEKVIERINCKSDKGHEYLVVVVQNFVEFRGLNGLDYAPGAKKALLIDGSAVNFVGDEGNVFKIHDTGEIITRV